MLVKKASGVLLAAVILFCCGVSSAEEMKSITLPAPRTEGGMPLMQALKERMSARSYSARELEPQVMADLLWAAFGISRPDGKRTAPTARNMQEIDVYVATAEGVYLYDAAANMLKGVLAGDIRAVTGKQAFVGEAPVNLVFVADYAKMGAIDASAKEFYAATDTGYISENVYLYCASAGLATVARGWVDKPALEEAMKLRPDQKVTLAQTVGYPKQ